MSILTSETRNVDSFQRISLHATGHLDIRPGDQQSLTIEAHPDVLTEISTEVRNGELVIRRRKYGLRSLFTPAGPINYYVTVTDLHAIHVSGAASVIAARLATEEMDLGISGAATLNIELVGQRLRATISGAGIAHLAGQVSDQNLSISGSGAIEAAELASETCRIGISGAGRATVNVSERLDATISGSGTVKYLGRPVLRQQISGAGRVRSIQIPEPVLQGG